MSQPRLCAWIAETQNIGWKTLSHNRIDTIGSNKYFFKIKYLDKYIGYKTIE